MGQDSIVIKGAREHNLKNVDITIPRDKLVVPPVMLSGILTSSISKLLPGPGSEIVNVATNFIEPVYHEETITFTFEVIKVDLMKEVIMISVEGTNENGNRILDSVIMVRPPRRFNHQQLENNLEKEVEKNE